MTCHPTIAKPLTLLSGWTSLAMVTLLPAFAFFVLATRWRVLVEWKRACAVGGLILLGLLPYAYPVVRCLDPDTPYLAHSVTNLAQLWGYATGDRRPDGATALFP